MSINNLDLISPLLNFEKEGDFYMLYVFRRKKDQPETERDNHQSVRTIKTYCIDSLEYLNKRWDEITHLCEHFKARAYIHIQKQNHTDVGFNMLVELANRLQNGNINQSHLFSSVVGQLKTYNKRWIVDLDTADDCFKNLVIETIDGCSPILEKTKTEAVIPTKCGCHLITSPFDTNQFKAELKKVSHVIPDIQKRNPTLLFLPDSLL